MSTGGSRSLEQCGHTTEAGRSQTMDHGAASSSDLSALPSDVNDESDVRAIAYYTHLVKRVIRNILSLTAFLRRKA